MRSRSVSACSIGEALAFRRTGNTVLSCLSYKVVFPPPAAPARRMSTGFCAVGFSLAEISLTDFGTTVRRSRALRTCLLTWTYVPLPQGFFFTDQSWVTPRPWGRTFHKCASLELPSPYHFSRPDPLPEITPTIACHFHRGFELWIPFVIVAFSGTRVRTGF